MADIARMDYRIKLSFIGEKWGLIIEYRLNFKPTFWKGLPPSCSHFVHIGDKLRSQAFTPPHFAKKDYLKEE